MFLWWASSLYNKKKCYMRTNEKHMQPALFILKHLSGSPTVSAVMK